MPKILINELDKTSPGGAGAYANYSVLIAGLMGREPVLLADAEADESKIADNIQPDANGVYEFSSYQAFEETIGLVAPQKTIEIISSGDSKLPKSFISEHYGNQMAYELLKLGYTVIYKPVTALCDLGNNDTWEIFKDKASYDFRFVTHGLLKSSKHNMTNLDFEETHKTYKELDAARNILINCNAEAMAQLFPNVSFNDLTEEQKAEIKELREELYQQRKVTNSQFMDENDTYYPTYDSALSPITIALYSHEQFIKAFVDETLINTANTCIMKLAEYTGVATDITSGDPANEMDNSKTIFGRGDCTALIELDEALYLDDTKPDKTENLIIDAVNIAAGDMKIDDTNGKYCAMTVPSVIYKMSGKAEFNGNKKFPGSFHYLACFINSLKQGFAEWYAAAGYTRGVSSYIVDYTTVKLGEIAINALEPRNYNDPQEDYPKFACNVIANFRGSYYLWGNRTAHPLGKKGNEKNGDLVASSFLNIRQLCSTIKKQLYISCRRFTFDPNSDTLWFNFVNAIKPTLELMKADQGVRDYKIIKVPTDKKATLKAKIRIIPIEAVEDFDIDVSLEDSFGETAVIV